MTGILIRKIKDSLKIDMQEEHHTRKKKKKLEYSGYNSRIQRRLPPSHQVTL